MRTWWRHGMETTSALPALNLHDDVTKWKYFPRYWPFVRGIHRSPHTKASDAELLCFLWYPQLSKQWRRWWFETLPRSLWPFVKLHPGTNSKCITGWTVIGERPRYQTRRNTGHSICSTAQHCQSNHQAENKRCTNAGPLERQLLNNDNGMFLFISEGSFIKYTVKLYIGHRLERGISSLNYFGPLKPDSPKM